MPVSSPPNATTVSGTPYNVLMPRSSVTRWPPFSEANPLTYLKDYVQTYLREEVMQEGLTRNIAHFSRFLEVASFSQGQTISVSEVSREARIERSVADNYFSILEDLLLAIRLPVFTRKAKRKLMIQKKFYFFDSSLVGFFLKFIKEILRQFQVNSSFSHLFPLTPPCGGF